MIQRRLVSSARLAILFSCSGTRQSSVLAVLALFIVTAQAGDVFAQSVRRDLGSLDANGAALQALQRAIATMKALPANDPHSWAFQANIHGAPAGVEHPDFNQCQHANWWFFPWHRAYLYFFERIARRYAGEASFALPYWNYADARQRALPAAYRNPISQLYDATRRAAVNNGTDVLTEAIVVQSTSASLAVIPFADFNPRAVTFGGPAVRQPQHTGATFGALENLPHNWVHAFVGGNMAGVETAPRDPIFFAHHANIDRLWEIWLRAGGGRANPSDPAWLDQSFVFYDENKRRVSITVRQCVDSAALGYSYEGLNGQNTVVAQPTRETNLAPVATARLNEPRRIDTSVSVTLSRTEQAASRSRQFVADVPNPPRQVYLSMGGVHFTPAPDSSLAVFINVPANGRTVSPADRHFAGYISFFGEGHHDAEAGLACTLDITPTMTRLQRSGEWNWNQIQVTLERVCPGSVPAPAAAALTFNELSLLAHAEGGFR